MNNPEHMLGRKNIYYQNENNEDAAMDVGYQNNWEN